jgi:hypothetical protein
VEECLRQFGRVNLNPAYAWKSINFHCGIEIPSTSRLGVLVTIQSALSGAAPIKWTRSGVSGCSWLQAWLQLARSAELPPPDSPTITSGAPVARGMGVEPVHVCSPADIDGAQAGRVGLLVERCTVELVGDLPFRVELESCRRLNIPVREYLADVLP